MGREDDRSSPRSRQSRQRSPPPQPRLSDALRLCDGIAPPLASEAVSCPAMQEYAIVFPETTPNHPSMLHELIKSLGSLDRRSCSGRQTRAPKCRPSPFALDGLIASPPPCQQEILGDRLAHDSPTRLFERIDDRPLVDRFRDDAVCSCGDVLVLVFTEGVACAADNVQGAGYGAHFPRDFDAGHERHLTARQPPSEAERGAEQKECGTERGHEVMRRTR